MAFRNLFLFIALTLFLGFAFTGNPSRAQNPLKFRIHVSVTCDNEHTKSLIQSYTKRELRSLGDVIVVSFDDAYYILNIVAVEPHYEATGRKTGAIATGSMLLRKTPDKNYYYPDLWVHTYRTVNLEELCKSRVAQIDTQFFEPIRELFQ